MITNQLGKLKSVTLEFDDHLLIAGGPEALTWQANTSALAWQKTTLGGAPVVEVNIFTWHPAPYEQPCTNWPPANSTAICIKSGSLTYAQSQDVMTLLLAYIQAKIAPLDAFKGFGFSLVTPPDSEISVGILARIYVESIQRHALPSLRDLLNQAGLVYGEWPVQFALVH